MKKLFSIIALLLVLLLAVSCDKPETDSDFNDDIIIDEHVHSFGEWQIIEEATCVQEGFKEATCNCGEKSYATISPAGHKMVDSLCEYCGRHYSEGLAFESNGDGTCYVTGMGDCTEADVVIPDYSPDGDLVTGIGYKGFIGDQVIESVHIPATVTDVGGFAFENCQKLHTITVDEANEKYSSIDGNLYKYRETLFQLVNYAIGKTDSHFAVPYGVRSIEYCAFYGSQHLQSIYLPGTVNYINGYSTLECQNLASFKVDEGSEYFEAIDGHLFTKGGKELIRYAPARTDSLYIIPDGVESLAIMSFADSVFLKEICVPKSLISLESYVFLDCIALESFYVSDDMEGLPVGFTEIPTGLFDGCISLKNVMIPEGVTKIGKFAFNKCPIENIIIPDSVEVIDENAFANCDKLTSITFGNGLQEIRRSAFNGCTALRELVLPSSLTSVGSSAFWGCDSLNSIVFPTSLTSIESYAFYCEQLKLVYYCGTAEEWDSLEIAYNAKFSRDLVYFYSAEAPTERGYFWRYVNDIPTVWSEYIPLPENKFYFTSNGDGTCTLEFILKLNNPEVVVPSISPDGETVTVIGYCAFSNDVGIKSITIPDSVITIEGHAFSSIASLTSITLGQGVKTIEDYAFEGLGGLKEITIPDSVESIGIRAFSGCTALETVTLGSGIKAIPENCFYECRSLKNVTIPEGVVLINEYAFAFCDSLKEINIPSTATEINFFFLYGSYNVEAINVAEDNTAYCSIDGNMYDKEVTTLIKYAVGKSDEVFRMPDSLREISYYALG